jgi:hypothetical protein
MNTANRRRSVEEWGQLLGVDASILTPADVEWFEQEDQWIAGARALIAEVLNEYPEEQDSLLAQGDA